MAQESSGLLRFLLQARGAQPRVATRSAAEAAEGVRCRRVQTPEELRERSKRIEKRSKLLGSEDLYGRPG